MDCPGRTEENRQKVRRPPSTEVHSCSLFVRADRIPRCCSGEMMSASSRSLSLPMEQIPCWAVISAALAPPILVGGWTLAAALQPPGYDPVRDTISALAGHGAKDRWVMTSALAGLGVCHIASALGLRPAHTLGRAILAGGGVATLFVAGLPLPAAGRSRAHAIAAGTSFFALGAWPLFAARRAASDVSLRIDVSVAASGVLLSLVAWFVVELRRSRSGLAERIAAGAQALWPFAVVITARRAAKRCSASRRCI
jgi:hypothetical membrane protein